MRVLAHALTHFTPLDLALLSSALSSQAAVPDAIKALKDKKAWFSEQPRPTATTAKPAQVRIMEQPEHVTRDAWQTECTY